jgi:rubrerythrin/nucleotide-binding universal stress UspA family protein
LKRAIELAREFGGTVEAISVFDPYFHYAMFHSIAGVLSTKAQKVFRFKEQEKLHEEIIDSGLAKIYTAHLEVAKKIAEDEGVELKTTLLAGKPFEQTFRYIKEVNPTLVVMGRIGYHSDDEMDIGGNTENMMRYLPTNVLVTNFEYQAPDLYTAEQHMTWTKEALERMDRVPGFVVGMATGAVIRYAIEKGYTVITTGVIDEVIKNILPPGAMESMRAIGDQMRDAEAMGEDAPIDSLFKDFEERTKEANGRENGSANGSDQVAKEEIFEGGRGGFGKSEDQGDIEGVSADVQEEIRRSSQGKDRFECDVCRYVAKGKPAKCPVCGSGPTHFHAVDAGIATADEAEGDLNLSEVYDGRELHWTDDARTFLESLEEWQEKRRVKARVEKSALKKGYTTITREYVEQQYREETGREAPEVQGGCPVSHAKQQVQESSGGKCPIDHSAFQKAGNIVPEGGSKEFTWTQEAIERLQRAPKGFMRNISRNMTEKLARERGTTHVDLALVEDSLAGARNTMEDVIIGKVSISELARDQGEKIEAENGEAPHPPMIVTMVCNVCGEELQGVKPPDECPVCGAPPEDFEAREP